jgi:hypothetical protein
MPQKKDSLASKALEAVKKHSIAYKVLSKSRKKKAKAPSSAKNKPQYDSGDRAVTGKVALPASPSGRPYSPVVNTGPKAKTPAAKPLSPKPYKKPYQGGGKLDIPSRLENRFRAKTGSK